MTHKPSKDGVDGYHEPVSCSQWDPHFPKPQASHLLSSPARPSDPWGREQPCKNYPTRILGFLAEWSSCYSSVINTIPE